MIWSNFLSQVDVIDIHTALTTEPKIVKYVVLDNRLIGRKLGNELFLDFSIDIQFAKYLKNVLKTYKPIVIPYNHRPALLTNTGQTIVFSYDAIYWEGIIKPVFFSKLYSSDVFDVKPMSLLARAFESEFDLDTAKKLYLEAVSS